MSAYTIHAYGIDLTEKYFEIQADVKALLSEAGITAGPGFFDEHFDLGEYLALEELGESNYDGGGYGQISFIGLRPTIGPRGIHVDDDMAAKVDDMLFRLPDPLGISIRNRLGGIPEAAFLILEGYD